MARYLQIAKSFTFAEGSNVYVGPVILTDENIYLTSKKTLSAEESLKRQAGLVGHALSKLVDKEADPFEYAVPLPEELLNDSNWPAPSDIKTAVVINKNDAEKVSYSMLGSMIVVVKGVKFAIAADFMKRKKILRILKENDWKM